MQATNLKSVIVHCYLVIQDSNLYDWLLCTLIKQCTCSSENFVLRQLSVHDDSIQMPLTCVEPLAIWILGSVTVNLLHS